MLAATSMLLSLILAVPAGGWDHPGYDAEDSYYNPHETVLNADALAHGLHTRWAVPLRKLATCSIYFPMVVAAGKIAVSDHKGISAYATSTGRAAWHFDWPDPFDAGTPTMAASGDVLIVANHTCMSQSDPDGSIVALDLATGRVRWRVNSTAPMYSLAVDKGMAVAAGGSLSDEFVTVAYEAATGKVAWQKTGYDSSGVSADGRLLLNSEGATSAVSITTGAILWTRPVKWLAQAATDRFLVNNGTAMSAVDAASGHVVWTAAGKATIGLATDGRRIYRTAPHQIEALNAATGRRVWSRRLTAETPAQPIRAGGLLYTGGPILNPATGAIIRPTTPLATPLATPVITDGVAYVIQSGKLLAYTP